MDTAFPQGDPLRGPNGASDSQPDLGAGRVVLVGAGPGDPGLITVRGMRLLRQADVVVFDDTVHSALLREVRRDAELVPVGARAGERAMSQHEIIDLVVERARAGKRVVRLTGDDPFVVRRGGAEAEALHDAGVPWDFVPGITSSLATPAYAGIPVAQRDHVAAFVVASDEAEDATYLDGFEWSRLAPAAVSLVVQVTAGPVQTLVDQLARHGWPASTRIAVIARGTTPGQQTASGTLSDIVEQVYEAGMAPPLVVVVGNVVDLRTRLRWFDRRPLFGRHIVITRAGEQAPELAERLEELGAAVTVLSSIRIEQADDFGPLDRAISQLETFDWVLFTSVNGVHAFASRLWQGGRDWRALHRARVGAIGPATARALERLSLRPDLVPDRFVAEGILDAIGNVAGQRILLPRTDIARATLVEQLRIRGADVLEVVAYRTVTQPPDGNQLRQLLVEQRPDAITFTSSSTVRGFVDSLIASQIGEPRDVLEGIALACIGPITAETVRGYGLAPTLSAEEYTMNGLTNALVRHFTRGEHQSEGVAAR